MRNPRCEQRDVCRLTAHIRGTAYLVRPIPIDTETSSEVTKAWRLRKADGTEYCVADTIDGVTCDCGDFVFRHDGHGTHCKHIRALRVLGLIDPEGDNAHEWPSWTDTHAFAAKR